MSQSISYFHQFLYFYELITYYLVQDDPQSPGYCSSPQPTEQFVNADLSVVKVCILQESLVKVISMGLSIMQEIK